MTHPTPITGQLGAPAAADDPMAGHNDGDRVAVIGRALGLEVASGD